MIALNNISKLYGPVIGVNDIDIELSPGVYGLLGPNGSGKTTLINLILGQIKPTLGSVRLFGENPWRRSRLLRRVGLCPTLEFSYPRITALQWVTYLVEMHGFTRADATARAKTALEQVRLDHVMHRPMTDYSLGMRQRAKLAQAMAHEPELLILDEPFNGLDPVGRFEMTALLKQWAADGRSLIVASHILHEVEAVGPSFLLIYGGRLLASGAPQEMRQILADSVNTLKMRSDNVQKLASVLCLEPGVKEIKFLSGRDIEFETSSPRELLERLPDIVAQQGVSIEQIVSSDDSLQTLFATLMKMQRGQIEIRRKL